MCGICGIVDYSDKPIDPGEVVRMRDVMVHRGPDDCGLATFDHAALGHRRLSIIDLGGSKQPMSNEDDSIWLVYNGEIYGFGEHRRNLISLGHRFKTQGDSETIIHLYEEYGLRFVEHLNGMFAIALWDIPRRRLVLARDRLGIKPLYYALCHSRLIFASEAKAVLEADGVATDIDREGIAGFLNYSSIPGELTGFRDIKRLLPGHLAVFNESGIHIERYWDIDYAQKSERTERDIELQVEQTLRSAVELRMISDVPFGAFLSGGVDSSLVAAMMAAKSSSPVEAFSVGYGREGAFMNEIPYAEAVAKRYGMNHRSLILDSEDLLTDLERVAWHLDEPCGDPAAFLTLALSRFTRQSVTVSLSGLGADEFFAGYPRYQAIKFRHRYLAIPGVIRKGMIEPVLGMLPESRTSRFANYARVAKKFVASVDSDLKTSWRRTVSYLPQYDGPILTREMAEVSRETYSSDAFESYWRQTKDLSDPVDRVMYMDAKMYMVDQLLLLQDKMSMAVSLEARVPFLDYRLVELAAGVDSGLKLRGRELKAILKRLAERYIPRHCIYRPKKGFQAPVGAWLSGPLRDQVHEALSPSRVADRGIFETRYVSWMLKRFYEDGWDLAVQLYQAFLLETWMRLYLDGEGAKFKSLSGRSECGATSQ